MILSLYVFVCLFCTGMVTINAPETTVCYGSTPQLNCTFEEASDKAGWNLTRESGRFELNTGSVVEVGTCTAADPVQYKSCVKVTLKNVTGIWTGKCTCVTLTMLKAWINTEMTVKLLSSKKLEYTQQTQCIDRYSFCYWNIVSSPSCTFHKILEIFLLLLFDMIASYHFCTFSASHTFCHFHIRLDTDLIGQWSPLKSSSERLQHPNHKWLILDLP